MTTKFILGPHQLAWLEALESGTREQSMNRLRDNDAFCCLGVACDIVAPTAWVKGGGDFDGFYWKPKGTPISRRGSLDNDTVEWLGLHDNMGRFMRNGKRVYSDGSPVRKEAVVDKFTCLTDCNDKGQWTFKQIAAFCREHPTWVFEASV